MEMATKKYAEFSEDLYNGLLWISISDTIEGRRIVGQIEEVANKTGKKEWKLLIVYAELEVFRRKHGLYGNDHFPMDELLDRAWQLLEETKKENVRFLELIVRQKIIDFYWNEYGDYELAFEQFKIQEERLQDVSSEDIPEIPDYFIQIANAHYYFKDYAKAINFYNSVLEVKDNIRTPYPKQHARNGLGISYCYGFNDLDRSDSCFLAVLHDASQHPEEGDRFRENWTAIPLGNMGKNMLLRGEYEKAIPLLKKSLDIMLEQKDFAFASGVAVGLAKAFLKTGNKEESKHYIDLAKDLSSIKPRNILFPGMYEVLSLYYSAMGQTALSTIYMDSMLQAIKQNEELFNAILLLRMEQNELYKHQLQLVQEKEIKRQIQMRLLILTISFMLIFSLLGVVFILYRRKQAAYRELVRKSQEWAQTSHSFKEKTVDAPETNVPPHISEFDRQLFDQLQQLVQVEHLHRNATVSIEEIAHRMKVNRTYLSRAINRCTSNNFNAYINEYRIKEAVRLMSNDSDKYSIEGFAFEVGFNDRKTFYNAFKKMTGLSPSDFRSNLLKN